VSCANTIYDTTGVTVLAADVLNLDFGSGSTETSTIITGVSGVTSTSIVNVTLRAEETSEHNVNDLLVDPIRVQAHSLVPGVGFTVTGSMDNATANGNYKVNWILYQR
jgi:hypothetical protein